MPTDSGERRPSKASQVGAPPQGPEHLPCPRCESTNTKFCYYNNYNFSQPRHFCKTCRRYWTHGGTLRDIPVGGGSRKNAKRSRTSSAASYPPDGRLVISTGTPVMVHHGEPVPFVGGDGKPGLNVFGSFTSLLHTQGPGLFALGGLGLGIGSGFEDVGCGLGRGAWPYGGIEEGGTVTVGGGGATGLGNTWQAESGGEGGFVGGDCCFTFPGLAISAPGNAMKMK